MSELLTNFKDDILAESMEGKRRYQMITNDDGTVSFIDVTEYEQVGSEFGQAEINAIHREINSKFDSGDVVDPLVVDETGFAADAKLTGDALREVSANTPQYNPSDDYLYINGERWMKANIASLKLIVNGRPTGDWPTATKNITNGVTVITEDGYLNIKGATKDVNNFAVFTTPINVSGYNTLSIEALCSSADSARIGFVTSLSPSDYTKMTQYLQFATNGYQVKTLDVSIYNMIYLAVYFYGTRYFDIKNILVK